MKRKAPLLTQACFTFALTTFLAAQANNQTPTSASSANQSAPIPMDQLGAVAGKQYQGDGLSVIATADGARLRCAFQRLEGQVTREGLWLSSTTDNKSGELFRVRAISVGRSDDFIYGELFPLNYVAADVRRLKLPDPKTQTPDPIRASSLCLLQFGEALPPIGIVSVADNVARFIRPGLTEEYTVSVDGVRQDFIIEQRPDGDGELRVELDVTGARAEPLVNGARLVLDGSGRKLAYNRLRVTDATGRELLARMEVQDKSEIKNQKSEINLAVLVDDAAAIYPVRIDPTFSDADWISMGGLLGTDGTVRAAVVDTSGILYIGGKFTIAGDVYATNVARWDGSSWLPLGFGMDNSALNGQVNALAVSGTDLFAGGLFTTAGGVAATNIAKWNGNTWSALGLGINGAVTALAVSDTHLFAGGLFTKADELTANNIAKWDGNAWAALGSGMDSSVSALLTIGTILYAGGGFTSAGDTTANRIAKWDGSVWSPLGSGMNSFVSALAVSGTNLYAGGGFTSAGDTTANRIAKWDGSVWSPLGSGITGGSLPYVYALAVSGTNLYVGGQFFTAGGLAASRVAKWNGNAWSSLDLGVSGGSGPYVYALTTYGSNSVFVGGDFTAVGEGPGGGIPVSQIAKWDGIAWSAVGSGLNNYVLALAVSGTNLYVGGRITMAGGVAVNRIARWDGSAWFPLGSGVSKPTLPSSVSALIAVGNDLIVGGNFTEAGGVVANNIAKWNGSTWSTLGSGMNNTVRALALLGEHVYAGGEFYTAGGMTVNAVAKWDGSNWSSLAGGVGPPGASYFVYALTTSGTDLYAGGSFTTAGGNSANHIAKWDGNSWSGLGTGIGSSFSGEVLALAVSGTDLYAGGNFSTAGGTPANCIAKWDGIAWSPLGSGITFPGISAEIHALAVSGTDLYAGGLFTTAGEIPASRIAKWNGSAWSALGSGVGKATFGSYVFALAVSGSNLYVGGDFTTAGNKISASIAKANIGAARGRFSNLLNSPPTGFSCTFLDASVGQPYRIQTSPSLAASSWTDYTNFTYTAPVVITVPVTGNTNRFFRAITP